MNDVNWWLMGLAFLLGLVLTFALMIRRVRREVPVYESVGSGALGAGAVATGATASGGAATKLADTATAKAAATTDEPYGPGSARVASGAVAPSGYTIKGNENSMLYHTTDSPSYAATIAEIWFKDEESAVRAGFTPWHKGSK